MVLTDHSPRLTVAHGLSKDRLEQQFADVAVLNEKLAPFRILTGIEVDILEDGALDHDDEVLSRLDIVVASVHSKLRMERQPMTERMVRAVASPHVDILGHCTGRMIGKRPRRRSMPTTCSPPAPSSTRRSRSTAGRSDSTRLARCCRSRPVDYGCYFSIDSDAHATGQLEWQPLGCNHAAESKVPLDRVINTWAADDLLRWTRRLSRSNRVSHVLDTESTRSADSSYRVQTEPPTTEGPSWNRWTCCGARVGDR